MVFFAALCLSGCAATPPAGDAWARYHAAIADAAVSAPSKVLPLKPLPAGDRVGVVSWVTEQRVPCTTLPCTFTVSGDRIWVTLADEVKATCRRWALSGDALRVRLEQLLGLPPDTPPQWRKNRFVLMQVPRASIERPCLGVVVDASGVPRCTVRAAKDTPPALQDFVLRQMGHAFVANGPTGAGGPGYPFTRLGYTYDWHEDGVRHGNYGASEFVLPIGTPVTVTAQVSTDSHCAASP